MCTNKYTQPISPLTFPKISISTTMDSPENPTGKSPRSLQGPRPAPLRVHKDSHKIRKPPVAPPQHHHHHQQPPPHHQQQQQLRPPVIIYTVSPKVIHTNPNEFMTLVQRLTGPSAPSPVGSSFSAFDSAAAVDSGAVSPAARFASIERAVKSPEGRKPAAVGDVAAVEGVEMSYFPGILSPAPGSLPPIPANFFSPLSNDFFSGLISPGLHNNSFVASPTNLLSSRIVSPTTPNFDLFTSLFDL
ncbi:putative VQ motif-containing protein/18/20/21/25 [Helianthus annuus]|nr:putative VQ motif-containing protein/18/20/21/25 [Helianthus annuus]